MFITASSKFTANFYLLTFGDTCLYLSQDESGYSLYDCGASWHAVNLEKRLEKFEIKLPEIKNLYLSSSDFIRISGLPYLLELVPNLNIFANKNTIKTISDIEWLKEAGKFNAKINNLYKAYNLKTISFNQYQESFSKISELENETSLIGGNLYFDQSSEVLVADYSFGIFQGLEKPIPTTFTNYQDWPNLIHKLKQNCNIKYLALPFMGVMCGMQVTKYLHEFTKVINAIINDYKSAQQIGLNQEEILKSISETYFSTNSKDPVMKIIVESSFLNFKAHIQ
jgi:hypothetical protein